MPQIKHEAQQAKTQTADDIEQVKEHAEPTRQAGLLPASVWRAARVPQRD